MTMPNRIKICGFNVEFNGAVAFNEPRAKAKSDYSIKRNGRIEVSGGFMVCKNGYFCMFELVAFSDSRSNHFKPLIEGGAYSEAHPESDAYCEQKEIESSISKSYTERRSAPARL